MMYYEDVINIKEEIIECLIIHQPGIKKKLQELASVKEAILYTTDPAFRLDILEQYEIRVKQIISFFIGELLPSVPIEYIIIELDGIDIEEYLSV